LDLKSTRKKVQNMKNKCKTFKELRIMGKNNWLNSKQTSSSPTVTFFFFHKIPEEKFKK